MKKTLKFLKEHKQFTFFGILAILIILAAIFAPLLTGGVDPLKGSLTEALEAPSKEHIFGTDKMGRDIYARVIYGARASLTSTFGVVVLIFLVGSVVGVIAGYFGGKIDAVLMRIADMMLAFPGLVLALAVAGIMGASIRNAIIAIVAVNCCHRDRIPDPVYAASLHAAKCAANTDHYGSDGCRRYDAGDRRTVLPGIWCKAAYTGMGLYAE